MNEAYSIFVVDDDKTMRMLLSSMLGSAYNVETFESSEQCLLRLADSTPDLFLLDVGLPGMNGYDLCRRIREMDSSSVRQVIFITGNDAPEEILAGYEAGAEDYVLKPFDVVVLHHKIETLRRIAQGRAQLSEQLRASDELSTLALANLDEYAVLIKFLRSLNECSSAEEIAQATLRSLDAFHLEGAIQVRMRGDERTFSHAGENWPLEIAVINHVRNMDRIFEFRTHCAYNFERITILVTNMPVDDQELCGRIRDHLAIAAESADAKIAALQSFRDNARMRERIHGMLDRLGATVNSYASQYNDARAKGTIFTTRILDDLLAMFAHLGMSSQQEEEILEMVKDRAEKLVDLYDIAEDTQVVLGGLGQELEALLANTTASPQENVA